MTGYLAAARVCRAVALLAVLGVLWLVYAGHPWWAPLPGFLGFLGFFMGRALNLGHNSTVTGHAGRTRHAHTDKETITR